MYFENLIAHAFGIELDSKPMTWLGITFKNFTVFNKLYLVALLMLVLFTLLYHSVLLRRRRQALGLEKLYKEVDELLKRERHAVDDVRRRAYEEGAPMTKMMKDLTARVSAITNKLELLHAQLDGLDEQNCIILEILNFT